MSVTQELQWNIVVCHLDGFNQQQTAEWLCTSRHTVRDTLNFWKIFHTVPKSHYVERKEHKYELQKENIPGDLTWEEVEFIRKLIQDQPDLFLDEIVDFLYVMRHVHLHLDMFPPTAIPGSHIQGLYILVLIH